MPAVHPNVIDVLRRPCTGPAVWRGPDLADSQEWVLRLSPAQIDELGAALRAVRERGVPLLKVRADDFPLPTLAGQLERIADALENGPGFVLVKGIPVERYSRAAASTVLWGLGQHLGVPVSQNAAGHMLGHSRDTGRTLADPSTRGYQTRAKLPFHTDGSDVLGLLCLRAARVGARTSVVSSAAVHNGVLARRPDLVEHLYRTHFLDRREDQAPGERPYHAVPLASWYGGKLSVRYNRCYLESAQRFLDVPRLEPADVELFDLIDELAGSPELRLDVGFGAGDLLLVNNYAVLHARTEFEDFDEPELKRHVLRLWLTLRHGRELPPHFWGDPHSTGEGPGRGGIAPRDVIATPAPWTPTAPAAPTDRLQPRPNGKRMNNLATALVESAWSDADRIAVRQDEAVLTYAQLDDASARVATLLRGRGVGPGDRVALVMPNITLFPVAYYGIIRAGGVVVPMNPLLKAREVAFTLRDSGARLVLVFPLFAEEVTKAAAEVGAECLVTEPVAFDALLRATEPMPEVVDRAEDDTAVILYTSGTTGTPKGAELTHRNLMTNTATTVETLLQIGPDDVLFGGLPLFHAFGQTCALNAAITAGATLTLLPRFEPAKALEIMHRDRVTVFLGVPTMYTALLHTGIPDGHDLSRLNLAVSGGASLPIEVLHGFEREFDVTVLEGYGLSETSPVAVFNPPGRPRKAGSIGAPIRGVEVRLIADDGTTVGPGEVGEIAIRGENVMKGYWNRPDATAEAVRGGWFHSGDLARVDEDGYYFIVDRKKDLIIRGGYNVYPREIEEVLYEHPAVAEAAVVGVPHDGHGEEVAAVVTLRAGADTTADEIRAFVKERVAAYKYPRIVTFTGALPKGATGKILKREIVVAEPAPTRDAGDGRETGS